MCVCVCVRLYLLGDVPHLLLQVVIVLGQSSVLLEQGLTNPGSQLQVPLFLSVKDITWDG